MKNDIMTHTCTLILFKLFGAIHSILYLNILKDSDALLSVCFINSRIATHMRWFSYNPRTVKHLEIV